MRVPGYPVHLTYCLNVHSGESWSENLAAIDEYAIAVRDSMACDEPFGLGLRISNTASIELSDQGKLEEFQNYLRSNNLYVFTVNGFPYGKFHGTRVKEDVYHPDWRTVERRDYTMRLADILAALLPDGVSGSISTSPGSYKEWIKTDRDVSEMVGNLADVVVHLDRLRSDTGRVVHVGLEPEPDCFLETTREVIEFFNGPMADVGTVAIRGLCGCSVADAHGMIARHVGVCFDTCHLSLQFEDLADSMGALRENNILISKVQVSAAMKLSASVDPCAALSRFDDPVYLHQVKIREGDGTVRSHPDLAPALEFLGSELGQESELRMHFHVPLYLEAFGELRSTSEDLTPAFFSAVMDATEHVEIETYTFDVLPDELRARGVVASVTDEYKWVLPRLHRP